MTEIPTTTNIWWHPAWRKGCGDGWSALIISPRKDIGLWINYFGGGLVASWFLFRSCRGERRKASLVQLWLVLTMSWLLYYQIFFVSIYPSITLEDWQSSYFFSLNIMWRSQYQLSLLYLIKTKSINTIFPLRKIINDDVNVICYYSKYILPTYLRSLSQNYYNKLSPLRIQMKWHDNIIYEKNQS